MKKHSLYFIVFMFTGFLFARSISFLAVETESNSVTECYGESLSTVTTKDNIEISLSLTSSNEGNYYRVYADIKNLGNEPYHFNDKDIYAYAGNFDENEWEQLDYLPARQFYEEAQHDANVKTVLAAVALGLAAIDSGLAPNPFDLAPVIPVPVPHRDRLYHANRLSHHDGDPVWVGLGLMNLFGTIDENEDSLEFLENHLLYSETIGPDEGYSGIFYIPKEKGPDFKITMDISNEESVDFYFSRTDRERVIHPFADTDENQFALIFTGGSSNSFFPHIGLDFGFFNNGLGGYFGYNFGYQESYHYEKIAVSFDCGFTEKLCPHLWIMGGLGCSIYIEDVDDHYSYDDENIYFDIGPEIGLNAIYGCLDFGGKVRYKIKGPLEFELMFGFAF